MTKQQIKGWWNATTTVLIGIAVILAMLIWGVKLIGMDIFVVQSGSMEPTHHVGSLIYVKEVDPNELKVGDVITFSLGGSSRGTHRIIEIVDQNGVPHFRTKGDANEDIDASLVSPANLVGKVAFSIPFLGYLIAYIQHPPGLFVAMAVSMVLLILVILPDFIFEDEPKKKKKKRRKKKKPNAVKPTAAPEAESAAVDSSEPLLSEDLSEDPIQVPDAETETEAADSVGEADTVSAETSTETGGNSSENS